MFSHLNHEYFENSRDGVFCPACVPPAALLRGLIPGQVALCGLLTGRWQSAP